MSSGTDNYKSIYRKYLNRKPCFQEDIFEHFNIDRLSGFLENLSIKSTKLTLQTLKSKKIIGSRHLRPWQ